MRWMAGGSYFESLLHQPAMRPSFASHKRMGTKMRPTSRVMRWMASCVVVMRWITSNSWKHSPRLRLAANHVQGSGTSQARSGWGRATASMSGVVSNGTGCNQRMLSSKARLLAAAEYDRNVRGGHSLCRIRRCSSGRLMGAPSSCCDSSLQAI